MTVSILTAPLVTISNELLVSVVVSLGLLSGIGYGIKAYYERKLLQAKANSDDATATTVVVAAARELVEPLRKELAAERAEHAIEIEAERKKVVELRENLERALTDLGILQRELSRVLATLEHYKTRVVELEEQLQERHNGMVADDQG